MSTDPDHPSSTVNEATPEPAPAPERVPDWWHRDHPTFTSLTGFFTGLAFVIVVPGLFAAILGWIFDYHTAEDLFPLVLVTLVVPIGLVIAPRTRRFGRYMLIGMAVTALVVGGVSAVVLWYMVTYQS
ncbi:hypothetical protein [Nocardioides sp. T2.26MG-1]|uniref:hypothetical protein n=1 Tax=Nocardioides sp. T2.26MG-1 TaxID=3041166 RepID=UPI002477A8DF|nr:hypothetical protein [Nocardioides sp. T2.26MG-1]CAI9419102.1 hypothetical protein HIDPHFAB_03524 [Nocardioides sp. T2.26MG-1]